MGHDIQIHQEYYRLPQNVQFVAKIDRILLTMEKGELFSYVGQKLDSIEIDQGKEILHVCMYILIINRNIYTMVHV